jgi:hypothetical protein
MCLQRAALGRFGPGDADVGQQPTVELAQGSQLTEA